MLMRVTPPGAAGRKLTGPQLALLGFLAGENECPGSVRWSTYAALIERGLIERGEFSRRYYVTDLGHRRLAHLRASINVTNSAVGPEPIQPAEPKGRGNSSRHGRGPRRDRHV